MSLTKKILGFISAGLLGSVVGLSLGYIFFEVYTRLVR